MDRELLIEIGVEELPAAWMPGLTRQLAERVGGAAERVPHRARRADRELQHAAAADRARGEDCRAPGRSRRDDHRSAGVGRVRRRRRADAGRRSASRRSRASPFDELTRVTTPKGEYLAYHKRQRGKSAVDTLPDLLGGVLRDLSFPKQMHWDATARRRPRRAAVRPADPLAAVPLRRPRRAVHDRPRTPNAAGPQVQDVESGALTYGHRFLATSGRAGRSIKVRSFDEYQARLAEHFVVLDHAERRDRIARELESHARRLGGRVQLKEHAALSTRSPISSSIPASSPASSTAAFLALPQEVLTTTLVHHQHYFPVVDRRRRAEGSVPRRRQHAAEGRAADREERRARGHRAAARREVLLGGRSQDDARVAARAAAHGAVPQEARQLPRQGRAHRGAGAAGSRRDALGQAGRGRRMRRRRRGSRRPISRPTWCSSSPSCRARWAASTRARKDSRSRSGRRSTTTTCRSASRRMRRRRARSSARRAVDLGGGLARRQARHRSSALSRAGERATGSRDPFGLRRQMHGIVRILMDLPELTGIDRELGLRDAGRRGRRAAFGASDGEAARGRAARSRIERVRFALEQRGLRRRDRPRAPRRRRRRRPAARPARGARRCSGCARRRTSRRWRCSSSASRTSRKELQVGDAARSRRRSIEPAELALLAELDARRPRIEQAVGARRTTARRSPNRRPAPGRRPVLHRSVRHGGRRAREDRAADADGGPARPHSAISQTFRKSFLKRSRQSNGEEAGTEEVGRAKNDAGEEGRAEGRAEAVGSEEPDREGGRASTSTSSAARRMATDR